MNLTITMAAGKRSCGVTKMIEKDYNDFVNEMLEGVVFLSDEEIARDTTSYKLSIIHKGKNVSEETRKKLSKINKGKKISLEVRNKMSDSHKGKQINTNKKYTKNKLKNIAKKYNRRSDFSKNDKSAYNAAIAYGKDFYNNICSHMTDGRRVYGTYTIAELRKRAKKFKMRGEFFKKDKTAYQQAWKMGILDEVCKHMKKNKN